MIKLLTLSNVKEAVIIKRIDRFRVLVRLEGSDVLAHNINTSRSQMTDVATNRCWEPVNRPRGPSPFMAGRRSEAKVSHFRARSSVL